MAYTHWRIKVLIPVDTNEKVTIVLQYIYQLKFPEVQATITEQKGNKRKMKIIIDKDWADSKD